MRKGFTLIEATFAIVIVGVLATVAITRFVTTRTDSAVATLRSDASVAQKAIVGKVFADNLITTSEKAPAPNDPQKKYTMEWGEWIMEISGIDKKRWVKPPAVAINADRGISPASNLNTLAPCGVRAMIEILKDGDLHFNPIALTTDGDSNAPELCKKLKASYQSSGGYGNKIIPLTMSKSLSF